LAFITKVWAVQLLHRKRASGTIDLMGTDSERGFTLIELVAAAVIIMLLLGASLFLLRTDTYTVAEQDAQRRTDVAHIVQALNKYLADNGHFPEAVPNKILAISSGKGHYDLCKYLVPKYLSDIPMDPAYGVKLTQNDVQVTDVCSTPNLTYSSGYGIEREKSGVVDVLAPLTNNESISIPVPNSANLQ
jgi:prepilin-type N-terminal cleavage/methylation domain-containing protein